MNILIIAPHPDDEVLGMGGTIKKISKKNNVSLLVMTDGASAQYSDPKMIRVRKESCKKSAPRRTSTAPLASRRRVRS